MAEQSSSKVRRLFELLRQRLELELAAASLFRSETVIGEIREEAVRDFLQVVLPSRYSLGVGEVIASDGQQTHQQDVVLYDKVTCSAFGWPGTTPLLFPIESVYAVIEVKSVLNDPPKAIEQACRAKKLPRQHSDVPPPYSAIFAKSMGISPDAIFGAIEACSHSERPDFVLISDTRDYFTHWLYFHLDLTTRSLPESHRTVKLVPSTMKKSHPNSVRLTHAQDEYALLWFYLSLLGHLSTTTLKGPDVGAYAAAYGIPLGWKHNE